LRKAVNQGEIEFEKTYLLIDRIDRQRISSKMNLHRLADSLQTAFDETNGDLYIEIDQQRIESFLQSLRT
jgi:hypothetical protein